MGTAAQAGVPIFMSVLLDDMSEEAHPIARPSGQDQREPNPVSIVLIVRMTMIPSSHGEKYLM